MPPKIASTVFKSGPDDSVAVVDVYRANTAETINAAKAAVSQTVGNGVTAVREIVSDEGAFGIETIKRNIAETIYIDNVVALAKETIIDGKLDKNKLKEGLLKNLPTKEDAINRLKDAVGLPIADIESLKTNLVTNLLGSVGFTDNPEALAKGLLGLPGSTDPINVLLDQNPQLKVVYDGAQLIRNGKDIKDAKGFVGLANSFFGNSELARILDMEAQFGVMNNLLAKASEYKMAEVWDHVIAKLEEEEERNLFILGQLDSVLQYGDVYLLRKILDANGRDKIFGKNPKTISLLLKNYELPFETEVVRQVDYDDLVSLLFDLSPNWYQYNRNGVFITDLGLFSSASKQAREVLSLNATYRELFMFADFYPSQDLVALSRRNYPRTGIPNAA